MSMSKDTGEKMKNAKILFDVLAKIGVLKKIPELLEKSPQLFKQVKNWWNGKNIAILGATASGKNSLFNRLCGVEVSTDYNQTRANEKIKNFTFRYKLSHANHSETIKFKCKNSINTSGEIDARNRYWLDIASKADIIFYLIDIQKVENNDDVYLTRLKSDFKWLSENMSKFKETSTIHILLNKIDTIINEDDLEEIDNLFSEKDYISNVQSMYKKILGQSKANRINSVHYMSMTDTYLFEHFFNNVLCDIYENEGKNK